MTTYPSAENKKCRDPAEKLFTDAEALRVWRESLRKEHRKLALTNGCFDILHRGHAEYLLGARRTADALLVLINSDASVRALKGPSRPVNTENDRAWLLASLECVDAVFIFGSNRCDREIALFRPDVYAKGADYTVGTLNPAELSAIRSCGAEIAFITLVPGLSTTALLAKSASATAAENAGREKTADRPRPKHPLPEEKRKNKD